MSDAAPELPQALAEFVQDGRLFHRAEAAAQRVQLALYRLIAAGLPVSADGLALAVGRDPVEVAEVLAAIPASNFLYDSGGQIVGFRGLGQVPTRHHLGFAGKRLFAWCAFDCLFLAALLGGALEVASACPASGAEIRLTVTPKGVAAAGPEATVLSSSPLSPRACATPSAMSSVATSTSSPARNRPRRGARTTPTPVSSPSTRASSSPACAMRPASAR